MFLLTKFVVVYQNTVDTDAILELDNFVLVPNYWNLYIVETPYVWKPTIHTSATVFNQPYLTTVSGLCS